MPKTKGDRYERWDSTCILDCPPLHAPSPRLHAIVVVPHESSRSLAILRPHPRRKLAILASGAERAIAVSSTASRLRALAIAPYQRPSSPQSTSPPWSSPPQTHAEESASRSV
ncbi:hypothetical protein C8J57DRAFT_1503443 [Mycena rebaudengoi]|nr:hypothetical protein C8J57DRAFT_1503443 [Mycena rebaudengoi]